MTVHRLFTPGPNDPECDYITGSGSTMSREEAQAFYNACREDGMLIYPGIAATGVWTATDARGDSDPRDILNWKA